MCEIVTLLNSENELTIQVEDSCTEWITINADAAMEIEQ